VVALPAGHALAARASVTFPDLRDESFINNPVIAGEATPARWLAEQHRHRLPGRVASPAASVEEILTLVAGGRGVCLVPSPVASRYPRGDVRYVDVSDAEPAIVSRAWRPGRPAVQAFIESARDVARAAP
jgi:DNA-binding transcriptional LysR family regulator